MKIKSIVVSVMLAVLLLFTFAGCSQINTSGADQTQPAADENTPQATESLASESADEETAEPLSTESAASTSQSTAEAGYDVGNALPDFSVPMSGGGTFTLSEKLDKPVFINLFATWCPPCVGEMPDIEQLYTELGDQVNFVAIDVGEDEATAQAFADQNSYTLPFAYSEDGTPLGTSYRVNSIPQTFVLSADGVIIAHYVGMQDYDTFKAVIQEAQ